MSNPFGVRAGLDLETLLAAVEAAPPIDATEVVAAALADALGARNVSFLIADYSGRSLIRLSHVRRTNADADDVSRERSQAVALAGRRMVVRSRSRRFRPSGTLMDSASSLP